MTVKAALLDRQRNVLAESPAAKRAWPLWLSFNRHSGGVAVTLRVDFGPARHERALRKPIRLQRYQDYAIDLSDWKRR